MVLNLGKLQNSHEGRITCLGLSADGSALCTGSWDSNLKVSVFLFLLHFDSFLLCTFFLNVAGTFVNFPSIEK